MDFLNLFALVRAKCLDFPRKLHLIPTMLKSYKNHAGFTINVLDLVFGFSPGVFRVESIDDKGLCVCSQIFDSKMKSVSKGRGIKSFHLDYARPFTAQAMNERIAEIENMFNETLNNYRIARNMAANYKAS